jgi:CHAD domain-containing protein
MKNKHPDGPWQPKINDETSLYDGYKHILTTQLQSLENQLHKQNRTTDLSPDIIHNIRVESRKLITATKLFKQITSKKLLIKIQNRAKNLMDHFGPVRNWDVFHTDCNNFNNESTVENKELFLQGIIWANQDRLKKNALKFLRVKGKKLAARFLKTTSKIFTSENDPASTSFFEWCRLSLMKILDDFKTNLNTIDYSNKGLHAFRLKIKFLRYGLEIMGDALPIEKSHSLHEALKKGQKVLGLINDLHFQIKQITLIQSSFKNQKEALLPKEESKEASFLKYCQEMLETNMGLFRSWVETTTNLIEI